MKGMNEKLSQKLSIHILELNVILNLKVQSQDTEAHKVKFVVFDHLYHNLEKPIKNKYVFLI